MTAFLSRRAAAVAVVVIAVAVAGAGLLLLRPNQSAGAQVSVPNLAPGHHYSSAAVRSAFAAQGVVLRVSTPDRWGVTLSTTKPPLADSTLYVIVERGTKPPAWAVPTRDVEIGNLDVHYGGSSQRVRGAVAAATAALRHSA